MDKVMIDAQMYDRSLQDYRGGDGCHPERHYFIPDRKIIIGVTEFNDIYIKTADHPENVYEKNSWDIDKTTSTLYNVKLDVNWVEQCIDYVKQTELLNEQQKLINLNGPHITTPDNQCDAICREAYNEYFDNENIDKSIELYTNALAILDNSSTALRGMVTCYASKKDKENALKYLQKLCDGGYNEFESFMRSYYEFLHDDPQFIDIIKTMYNRLPNKNGKVITAFNHSSFLKKHNIIS